MLLLTLTITGKHTITWPGKLDYIFQTPAYSNVLSTGMWHPGTCFSEFKISYLHTAFRKHPVRGNELSSPVWFIFFEHISLT